MAFDPRSEDFGAPTASDASRILSEITPVTRRSGRLARDVTLARPLLAWGLAWLAISPLLIAVVAPANAHVMTVFLARLWAVGMLLYGIGVRDIPLAGVGLAIVVIAAATRVAAPGAAMLTVGIAGGLAMTALGGWRMRWKR